jgi:hypothetical protein
LAKESERESAGFKAAIRAEEAQLAVAPGATNDQIMVKE